MTTLAVIGAINVDLVVTGTELPAPGRTVTGGAFAQHHGGKGGNQATAAARALGDVGSVAMIGAVGSDRLGREARDALAADGVDVGHVAEVDEPTGVALIVVDHEGENQIAVAPGANLRVDDRLVRQGLDAHDPAVVLVSLEIPREGALAAGTWCREREVPLVVNPAPLQPWATELAPLATLLTPNEHEREALGADPDGVTVIETRGSGGAVIHVDPPIAVVAPSVDAVDTTGAGDCFNGVLAAGLAEGLDVETTVRRAVVAAALSVAAPGARGGMPSRAAIGEIERA